MPLLLVVAKEWVARDNCSSGRTKKKQRSEEREGRPVCGVFLSSNN